MDVKKIGMAAASAMTLLAANVALAGGKDNAGAPKVVDGMFCQNNTCKGKSECKGYNNKAGRQGNGCAGEGWLNFDKKDACEKNGGKWADAKQYQTTPATTTPAATPAAKKH